MIQMLKRNKNITERNKENGTDLNPHRSLEYTEAQKRKMRERWEIEGGKELCVDEDSFSL